MKRILFFAFALLTGLTGFNQALRSRNLFSVSAGPCFPTGHFAGSSFQDEKAGLAGIGEQINFSFEHRFNKTMGAAAVLYGIRNPLRSSSIAKQLDAAKFNTSFSTTTGSGQPYDPSTTTYPNWQVDKKSWWNAALLIGPAFSLPLNARHSFSLTARGLAGVFYASSPHLQGKSVTDTVIAMIGQNSVSAYGFSYGAGAAVMYTFSKRLAFHAGADYLAVPGLTFKNATATFSAVTINNPLNSNNTFISYASQFTSTAKQSISSININIGMSIVL